VDYLEVIPTNEPPAPTPSPTPTVGPTPAGARQMERLDRGLVAVKVNNGVF